MQNQTFALKGDLLWSASPQEIATLEDGFLVCEAAQVTGVFTELPERYAGVELHDYTGKLIIPGLVDLHTHAPQFAFRGTGMDLELLDWLNAYAFPEEARYEDLAYARAAYEDFVRVLSEGATTRAAIFATIHVPATLLLMELLEASGLVTMVGKVNMNRNASPALTEASAQASLEATEAWLAAHAARNFKRTQPILTPRFIPSCTPELLSGLGALQSTYGIAVQSHLSENPAEIAWVRELEPAAANYAEAYLRHGLLGRAGEDGAGESRPQTQAAIERDAQSEAHAYPQGEARAQGCPTIMAHCVYSDEEGETELLKQQGVWVAHCPVSNTDIASGIAPVRRYLEAGLRMGLGTDVAGGYSPSMLHVMAETIKVSKLRWRLVNQAAAPLTLAEAFYLATKGGGSFWGKVGSFEPGYEFDAVVLDDAAGQEGRGTDLLSGTDKRSVPPFASPLSGCITAGLTLEQRLERLIYCAPDTPATAKYVAGQALGAFRRSQ